MNYLKVIAAAKQAKENGLSQRTASKVALLIKKLATALYDWDLIRNHYKQLEAIIDLADNMYENYLRGE